MDEAVFERIVRVEARFADKAPKIGTGFRLAPGRVLTAQHVLEKKGARATEILVSLDADGSGEIVEKPATVLWRGEKELDPTDDRALDAALLEDELPVEGLSPFESLVRLPQPGGAFAGAGYVKVSASNRKLHRPDGLEGRFDPIQRFATCMNLRIDGSPPQGDAEQPWGGISGAPIFIAEQGHRHQGWLYGVIRRIVTGYPDRVLAVTTTALVRDPDFCHHLGITEPPPPHELLVVRSRDLLKRNPKIARQLARVDPVWKSAWESGRTEGLLDAICRDGDVETLLEGLSVLTEAAEDEATETESLRDSALHLVTLLAHHELSRGGGAEEVAPGHLKLPFKSPNYGDAALASTEGGKALYRQPDPRPDGRRSRVDRRMEIPKSHLESGLLTRRQVADHVEELAATLIEKDLDRGPFLYDEDRQIIAGSSPAKRIERLAKAIDDNLRDRSRRRGRSSYYLIMPDPDRDQAGFDRFLKHLRKLLPSLVFLELGGDTDHAQELERKLKLLWRILDID